MKEHFENVVALRGVAALLVMWFHLTNGNNNFLPKDSFLRVSGSYGFLGVELFFVISGFVIPLAMARRGYTLSNGPIFFLRRIVRIEPAYLCSALLVVILQFASALVPGSHAALPSRGILTDIALHIAYLAPWFNRPWLSPVYWSLAIEFQYYAMILFAAPALLSRHHRTVMLFLCVIAIASVLSGDQRTLFPYLPLFGLGFVRFLATKGMFRGRSIVGLSAIYAALGCCTLGVQEMAAGLVAFAFLFVPIKKPVLGLSWLGMISYSLYLVHGPLGVRVVNIAMRFSRNLPVEIAILAAGAAVSIISAYIFWRTVERPTARLSSKIAAAG